MKYDEFVNRIKVICGVGCVDSLPAELLKRGVHSVLLLCDDGFGAPEAVKDAFAKSSDIKIKAAYHGSPKFADNKLINDLYDIYKLNQCDCIVVSGGNGITNTAKLLRMMLTTGVRNLPSLIGMDYIHGEEKVPFANVPSVLDVGGDATKIAVFLSGGKVMQLVSDEAIPDYCVIDPNVMKDVSPRELGLSCIGTLACAISAYTGLQGEIVSGAFALKAISAIASNVCDALDGDINSICRVGEAAVLSGIAVSNSMVGLTSALAAGVAGVALVRRSEVMPCVMEAAIRYEAEELKDKYAKLLFYVAGEERFLATDNKNKADECCRAIKELIDTVCTKCKIATSLSELGVDKESFAAITDAVEVNGAILSCARNITRQDISQILEKSY
ncbi:MAG: iron-containing alcohol dehydrogenase [Clostridia bacterium]|nr:iron-containing alcohol dehydrogenase [Clostridia bacterium]